ncbi:hypothetical protein AB0J35_51435 [Nonomuraea angiospora]
MRLIGEQVTERVVTAGGVSQVLMVVVLAIYDTFVAPIGETARQIIT